MARFVMIGVAIVAGVVGALLLVVGPTVDVRGETSTCPPILVDAEDRAGGGELGTGVCEPALTRYSWYAGGAGLVCLVAFTGVLFRYPKKPDTEARADKPRSTVSG